MKLEKIISNVSSGVYQPPLSVSLDCPSVRVAPSVTSTSLNSNCIYPSINICKINDNLFFNSQPSSDTAGKLGIYHIPTNTITYVSCPYDTYRGSFINVNGEIYIIGGFDPVSATNHSKIMRYKNGTIETMTAEIPVNIRTLSCCSIGTDIYIIGGYTGTTVVNTIYKYDTINDNISVFAVPLNVACAGTACCVYQNRFIYVVDGGSSTNKIQIIDTVDETVENMSKDLPVNRYGAGAMIKEDFLYVFGGHDSTSRNTVYKKYILDDSDWVLDTQTLKYSRFYFGYTSDEKGYYHIIGDYQATYGAYYETGRFGLPSADVEIRYTQTDDDSTPPDPTITDTLYTAPIELSTAKKHKIKAKAFYVGT